jgi:hypothetical protein
MLDIPLPLQAKLDVGVTTLAARGGVVNFANLRFGSGPGAQIRAEDGGRVVCTGAYWIVGGGSAQAHWVAVAGGVVRVQSIAITLLASHAFSPGFAFATTGGIIFGNGCSFTGSATGQQYEVDSNGVLQISGLTLPGSVAGATTTGGQVV